MTIYISLITNKMPEKRTDEGGRSVKKTRGIFLILVIVYMLIGTMGCLEVISVGSNLLFGLAVSTLLMSVSDICDDVVLMKKGVNEYGFLLKCTTSYLEQEMGADSERFMKNPTLCTVKQELINTKVDFEKTVHPLQFDRRQIFMVTEKLSAVLFALSVAAFILVPFVNQEWFSSRASILMTVWAFTALCLDLYVQELISDTDDARHAFWSQTQLMLQTTYPEFPAYLNQMICCQEEYDAMQEELAPVSPQKESAMTA